MPEQDNFASELRGDAVRIPVRPKARIQFDDDDGGPVNVKGNDWVASIVSALIVGSILAVTNHLFGKDKDDSATLVGVQTELVALKTKFEYLAASVNKITEQPYVRREEFQAGIASLENRLSGLDQRVDTLEHRASRNGRQGRDQ